MARLVFLVSGTPQTRRAVVAVLEAEGYRVDQLDEGSEVSALIAVDCVVDGDAVERVIAAIAPRPVLVEM